MSDATPGWAVPGAERPTPRRPRLVPEDHYGRDPGLPGDRPPYRHVDQTLSRPSFREPHRATGLGILSGSAVTVLWFAVTLLLGVDGTSRLWVTLVASLFAIAGAFLLARYGDRGAAAGVAAVTGVVTTVVGIVVGWPQVWHLLSTVF